MNFLYEIYSHILVQRRQCNAFYDQVEVEVQSNIWSGGEALHTGVFLKLLDFFLKRVKSMQGLSGPKFLWQDIVQTDGQVKVIVHLRHA